MSKREERDAAENARTAEVDVASEALRKEEELANQTTHQAPWDESAKSPAWRYLFRCAVALGSAVLLIGLSCSLFWLSLEQFEHWVGTSPEAPSMIEGVKKLIAAPALLWALPLGLSLLLVSVSLDLGLGVFRQGLALREIGTSSFFGLLRVAASSVGAQAVGTHFLASSVVAVLVVQGSLLQIPEPRAFGHTEEFYAPVLAKINEACKQEGRPPVIVSRLTEEDRRWLEKRLEAARRGTPPLSEEGQGPQVGSDLKQRLDRFLEELRRLEQTVVFGLESHDERVAALHGERHREHEQHGQAVAENYDRMADLAAVIKDQTDQFDESLERAQMDRRARFVRANVERDGSFWQRMRNAFSAREVADFQNDVKALCEDRDLNQRYRRICERYGQSVAP